jgi:hypothetical protein
MLLTKSYPLISKYNHVQIMDLLHVLYTETKC